MSLFIGTKIGETITPEFVSPSVAVVGAPNKPSAAVDFIFGGSGDDIVAGGGGNDFAFLGAGNDEFIWNPGDGSDFVDGGKGFDTMVFNGANVAENVNISSGALGLASFTRDAANITMTLNKVERIEFAALDGPDNIVVNDLSGTDVKQVAIDLAGTLDGNAGDGQSDRVTVNGTLGDDRIVVVSDTTGIKVSGLPAEVTIAHAEVANDHLVIASGAGADVIDASGLAAGQIGLQLLGGDGVDLLIGSAGDDDVFGGKGDDRALLGDGDDSFTWNPGDGSDVVEGEGGFDTMVFNGANVNENVDVSANGERVRFFRDAASITMDLNEVEKIDFAALGGADNIVVNDLSGTDVKQVAIDLAGTLDGNAGDGQSDKVTVNGTAADDRIVVASDAAGITVSGLPAEVIIGHAEGANDHLVIASGAGADVIDASGLAAGEIGLQLLGGDGADLLIGSAGGDDVFGGRGDDLARLGAGDDAFTWNPGDGSDVVEGGGGFDTMVFNGANVNENVDVSANGARAIFFRDAANITMDLDGVERIEFTALGGADKIVVNDLSGTDVSEVAIDLAGTLDGNAGDGQADEVTVNGTAGDDAVQVTLAGSQTLVTGLAAQVSIDHFDADKDLLRIQLGAGDDVVDASALPAGAIGLVAEGGDGDDFLLGGAGDDMLLGGAGDDVLLGGDGDHVLDGGDGEDTLIGGAGDDTFHNGEIIAGFVAGAGTDDRIDLRGVAGLTDFNSVISHAQDVGGNATLDLGNGEQMTLLNVSVAALSADD
ncbi:MAG: calcium-binding protein, partial [Burkholderiales bacterium]